MWDGTDHSTGGEVSVTRSASVPLLGSMVMEPKGVVFRTGQDVTISQGAVVRVYLDHNNQPMLEVYTGVPSVRSSMLASYLPEPT